MNNKRVYKLSDISDEKIIELMESVESEIGSDFSDDDPDSDPDFEPSDVSFDDECYISNCLNEMNAAETSDVFIQAINVSLNVSELEANLPSTSAAMLEHTVASPSTATQESTSASTPVATQENTFGRNVLKKKQKRKGSPLPLVEETGPQTIPSSGGFNLSSVENISKDSAEFLRITWRKQSISLHVNDVAFRGNSVLPNDIKSFETPMEYFCYFFTPEIMQMVAEETNRAAFTEDINSDFKTSAEEIHQYIGILMYMSVYRYPNLESYWGKNALLAVQKAMPLNKFKRIKRYLRFQDESERIKKGDAGYHPLFRIRLLTEKLNERFDSIPKTARLCVDEQMCSTKIKHHLRQYLPNKPHKWGIKLFVLCDSFGFAYRFEVYNGAGDNIVLPGVPDLGSCANVVVRLSQSIPDFVNHILYFDNFYTTLPLMVYLRARGIYSLGTMRVNRIPNSKLPSDKELKERNRGYSIEFTGRAYGIDISKVLWKDNKAVRLISTYVGIEPFRREVQSNNPSKITRYDRKIKSHIELDCPQIIKEYNAHMGGVDAMDGLIGRYHIRAKTRNPMTRIFYHLVDMAAINAYILYRRVQAEKQNSSANEENFKLLKLPVFREEIAAGLVTYIKRRIPGRKSRSTTPKPVFPIGHKTKHPVDDVRYDGFMHFLVWMQRSEGKKKCKLCKTSQTQCMCQKCNLHLCCSSTKNCFLDYHTKK